MFSLNGLRPIQAVGRPERSEGAPWPDSPSRACVVPDSESQATIFFFRSSAPPYAPAIIDAILFYTIGYASMAARGRRQKN